MKPTYSAEMATRLCTLRLIALKVKFRNVIFCPPRYGLQRFVCNDMWSRTEVRLRRSYIQAYTCTHREFIVFIEFNIQRKVNNLLNIVEMHLADITKSPPYLSVVVNITFKSTLSNSLN